MGGFIYRWRRLLITVLVVMVVTVSLSLTARIRGKVVGLSNIINTVVSPAESSMAFIGRETGLGVSTIGDIFTLQQQNRELKRKLLEYNSMKLELSEVLAENGQLRGLLGLEHSLGSWKLDPASIIARNPDSWFDTVVIDQGTNNGVHQGMAVIVPQGVVGRVLSAGPNTATVMLILDPKSGIGALDVRSQSTGVVLGQDPVTGLLQFQLFSSKPDVLPGDVIATSGLSQYYPKGLLIGQVVSVSHNQYGLTETATIKPAVDFNRLQTVMVVESHPSGASIPPVFGGGNS
ncbi:rod shape-determining protein MreC [Sulfobacillus thermosulfidooxidans]|uniref:Cell shape-determining protein MreC n=1 Tax=Sulfobacillus thermosulfidooxidans TaxID=28034 RepID=A0A1R0IKY9_SULTH|nr:rod shape-determining protein MreC [Sulfobacillus thermosulfidooxidans]OLZ10843.1 rod shape-determining protein MreC [Sulfobacillus thermosulfidooxidans]OLZ14331.1 rod shape-determining protein MreC [Sulfobacillus thermosulfidooxidans]OLZ19074.1 rod shape-determining protein MreC [Sulfobacillus thermosulfidooxidans]PSR28551.1 MAG: rod shape-determining protein MreC [Sulfobacillus thermosulfidooxidans]